MKAAERCRTPKRGGHCWLTLLACISECAGVPALWAIAVRYFWTYVEFRQCGDCLFHRQADYVCERALNLRDDLCATSLRRVSAGFVERIYFHKVIFDRCGVKPSKTHTQNVMKNRRSSRCLIINQNGRANFVDSSTQPPEYLRGFIQTRRFTDNLLI